MHHRGSFSFTHPATVDHLICSLRYSAIFCKMNKSGNKRNSETVEGQTSIDDTILVPADANDSLNSSTSSASFTSPPAKRSRTSIQSPHSSFSGSPKITPVKGANGSPFSGASQQVGRSPLASPKTVRMNL